MPCGLVPAVESSLEDGFVRFCRNDVYIAALRGGLHVGTNISRVPPGALAIAACSTDDGGGATVCTEVTLYRFLIIRSISARFTTLSQLT